MGFFLNFWIASVVSVVLYSASSPSVRRTPSFTQISDDINHSLPTLLNCIRSLHVALSPYLFTLLFIWIVFTSIILSSFLSFFLSPEFQSFSNLCHASVTKHSQEINTSWVETGYQSGPLVSELVYSPCPSQPSILIALRQYHEPTSHGSGINNPKTFRKKGNESKSQVFEIEILSRVASGNDLLLRIDLDYWGNEFLLNRRKGRRMGLPEDEVLRYRGVADDGWWVRFLNKLFG